MPIPPGSAPCADAEALRTLTQKCNDYGLDRLHLREVSVCTFPAYEGTSLSARAAERAECGKRQFDIWKEKAKERVNKWH